MSILEIQDLQLRFGDNQVLNGLNMTVPEHAVFGFVGRNGAGKTTTMRIVLGLLKAQGGTVTVCGERVRYGAAKTNRHIGFLPDVPEFYGYMRPLEYLKLCGEIAGLPPQSIRRKSEELLELVGLDAANRRISGFSRGMKQRLGIAQALLNEPRLLICDEPTSALDPIGRKQVLDILSAIRGQTTVVFSTHILSDVERICDRIAVLEQGRLVLSGTLAEIQKQHRRNSFSIRFAEDHEARKFSQLEELNKPGIELSLQDQVLTIVIEGEAAAGRLLIDLLSREKIAPEKFEAIEPTLESLFAEVVQ
ncbi:MAG: ABC transporter ATP-binding protein [Bacillota bacterium]|jgi:ABC-2 type transport system ATP-binding protein|nr:ABC transporter ATP-binding protein [Bacillota bacterium]HHT91742.1 ABC transporter ATP-binding protein [Bacillota bacterium]